MGERNCPQYLSVSRAWEVTTTHRTTGKRDTSPIHMGTALRSFGQTLRLTIASWSYFAFYGLLAIMVALVVLVVLPTTLNVSPGYFFHGIVSTREAIPGTAIFGADGQGFSPDRVLSEFVGPMVAVVGGPMFSALLFAMGAGVAVSAWLGQMVFSRDLEALRSLGVSDKKVVLRPIWFGLYVAALFTIIASSVVHLVVFWITLRTQSGWDVVENAVYLFLENWQLRVLEVLLYGTFVASATVRTMADSRNVTQEAVAASLPVVCMRVAAAILVTKFVFLILLPS